MKLAPSGIGAEPKKVALLAGIVALAVGTYWFENRSDAPERTVSANVAPTQVIAPSQQLPAKEAPTRSADPVIEVPKRRTPGRSGDDNSGMDDFRPSLKAKDDLDVSQIDPRIRLELLAKLRAVPLEGGSSNLFEFGKPPEPPAPPVSPINPGPVPPPPPSPSISKQITTGKQTTAPPPPPIPFKFYGYAGKAPDGQLEEGFFLEGDPATSDPVRKREGDVINDRYKVIRIGIRSAVVEDTVSHNQQTLPLIEEQQ